MFLATPTGECCRYFDLGDKLIANNSRVGSVSIYFALTSSGMQFSCVSGAPTKPVYMLVREPLARYLSATRKEAVEKIYPGTGNHFDFQSRLAVGPKVFLYRFPDHIKEFGEDTGLGKIPWLNHSLSSLAQIYEPDPGAILQRYSQDVRLFESISTPKTLHSPFFEGDSVSRCSMNVKSR